MGPGALAGPWSGEAPPERPTDPGTYHFTSGSSRKTGTEKGQAAKTAAGDQRRPWGGRPQWCPSGCLVTSYPVPGPGN